MEDYGINLVDNENMDLCYVAMKNEKIDWSVALMIMEYAEQRAKENPFHKNVWRARLITAFVEKLSREELPTHILNSVVKEKLQSIINRNIKMDYSKEQGKILSIINTMKSRYQDLKKLHFGLNFPLFSIDKDIRHNVWDYYNEEQMLYTIDKQSLNLFIQREKKGIELRVVVDDKYLIAATNEWQSREYGKELYTE